VWLDEIIKISKPAKGGFGFSNKKDKNVGLPIAASDFHV
jgi:hypothetical protein